ncbi:MAG: GntR family transcriptional regulator [Lachnospiraceae bacterium]|nr:GntR family transcriptional regulator [Lachnospiraceae bacterium]
MSLMTKKIDNTIPIPKYFQIKSLILDEIKSGRVKEGDFIPTEIQLADHFEVSRSTIRQAISELVSEGWLDRKTSKGTFVTQHKPTENYIRSFEPFYQQIERQNKTPSTELLSLQVIPADEILAEKLHIKEGEKIISMFRRRLSDNVPMVTIQNYLSYSLCSFILDKDFTICSLYELFMTNEDTTIHETKSIVSADYATPEDMNILQIKKDTPMLCFHNISTRQDGTVLDYAFSRYRGDLNKFEFIDTPKLHQK